MTTGNIIPNQYCLLNLKRSTIASGGGEKHNAPMVDWTIYQSRLSALEELSRWGNNGLRPSRWGIVTGSISGPIVFDAGSPEAVEIFHNAGFRPHVKKSNKSIHEGFTKELSPTYLTNDTQNHQ